MKTWHLRTKDTVADLTGGQPGQDVHGTLTPTPGSGAQACRGRPSRHAVMRPRSARARLIRGASHCWRTLRTPVRASRMPRKMRAWRGSRPGERRASGSSAGNAQRARRGWDEPTPVATGGPAPRKPAPPESGAQRRASVRGRAPNPGRPACCRAAGRQPAAGAASEAGA